MTRAEDGGAGTWRSEAASPVTKGWMVPVVNVLTAVILACNMSACVCDHVTPNFSENI